MSRTKLLIGGGIALAIALLAGGFLLTHKRVKKEVRVPPSGEARKNPLLALERLYTRGGLPTETTETASFPDDPKNLIFMADRRRSFTPQQIDKWVNWVRNGGHLILPRPTTDVESSPLLEKLGFTHTSDDPESEEKPEPEGEAATTYRVDWTFWKGIGWTTSDADWRAFGSDDTLVALSRRAQEGRVTLLESTDLFRNTAIGEAEHATLAWDIATLDAPETVRAPALIVLYNSRKSWVRYAVASLWPLFAILAVIIVLALIQGRARFGPLLPPPPEERRSRAEHIRAMGRFLWDRNASSTLLESARSSLIEELERKQPRLREAQGRERRKIVGRMLGIDHETVRRLFDDRDHLSADQFRSRIELIERYRRTL